MGDVIVRGMLQKDIDQVMNIERICFSMPWSKASLENELTNELAYYQVAEVSGEIAAYMGMWKIIDECHITNVAVLPEYRNKGIAGMLINKMIEICKSSEISLYKKFGFYAVGKRPNYYVKPLEDALIMWMEVDS